MAQDEGELDYKVGYRRPPRATRFKKGESGNPSGRRGMKVPLTLQDAANAIFSRKVRAQISGKLVYVSNAELMLEALVQKAQRKGDVHAFRALLPLLEGSGAFGSREPTMDEMTASLSLEEVAMVDGIRDELSKYTPDAAEGPAFGQLPKDDGLDTSD